MDAVECVWPLVAAVRRDHGEEARLVERRLLHLHCQAAQPERREGSSKWRSAPRSLKETPP